MAPKIEAPTILAQRSMRQKQMIDAALSLALEGGVPAITVSAVAAKAGLARSTFYEYFSSSADLISDLIKEELDYYYTLLAEAVAEAEDPYSHIEMWIARALEYVVDGRHILVKSLNSISIPEYRREEIGLAHRKLMTTITGPLQEIGIKDIHQGISFLQAILDVASVRIDSGKEATHEVHSAQVYALAGLRALATL